jgi:hypothetical protein
MVGILVHNVDRTHRPAAEEESQALVGMPRGGQVAEHGIDRLTRSMRRGLTKYLASSSTE